MSAVDRLDEIQARADQATEGPWDEHDAQIRHTQIDGWTRPTERAAAQRQTAADIDFVMHARTDVPALVLALRSVLNVHEPVDALHTPTGQKVQVCSECERDGDWRVWPCLTVRAVTNAFKEADR